MKRIIYLILLVQSGITLAQTKTFITPYGEKVTIHPNANNGLTAENGNVQLGGVLVKPTTINTSSQNILEIKSNTAGAIKITDGTETLNYVLTSDANGVANWKRPAGYITNAPLTSEVGITINYDDANFTNTGNYVDLAPGKWMVTVNFIMASGTNDKTGPAEYWFLRSSFTESSNLTRNGLPNSDVSADIEGNTLISATMGANSYYAILTGSVFINNKSGAAKRYYYMAGIPMTSGTTSSIGTFGKKSASENGIYYQRVN